MQTINPLGFDIFGRPFWAFQGAEDGDDDGGGGGQGDGTSGAGDGDDETDSDGLTAGGRKLIETERAAAREAKRALGPWRKLERELSMGPDQIREALAARGDTDKELDKVRREAESNALAKVNTRLVRAEIKAAATASFQDPEDAYAFVDLDEIDVDDDGNVDTRAVEAALKDVLRRKPHLAKQTPDDDDVRDFDGGSRTPPPKKTSMNQIIRDRAGFGSAGRAR